MKNNIPKVWVLNDCDWWMAPTLEQAINDYLRETGVDFIEAVPDLNDCVALSEDEMKTMSYEDDDGVKTTFFNVYQRYLSEGKVSNFFASTEY